MKFYYYVGLVSIVCLSFFYTERIANLALDNNPIYQAINETKDMYQIEAVNALIDDNKIIPGINGITVDVKKSYYQMKSLGVFNNYYLVYNDVLPDISINNNKDKIIKRGNTIKRSVAFIINNNKEIIDYFKINNIEASILINVNTFDSLSNLEQINNEVINYDKIETLLNKYYKNTNICYVSNELENVCRRYHKYLVKTDIIVDNQSYIDVKNNILSGDIYYITNNLSLKNMIVLLNTINYKDLKIVSLSKLISEDRD